MKYSMNNLIVKRLELLRMTSFVERRDERDTDKVKGGEVVPCCVFFACLQADMSV